MDRLHSHIDPKAADFLANRDRMVPKRELMDAVWPRMVVEENNLTQAISTLRRVLGVPFGTYTKRF